MVITINGTKGQTQYFLITEQHKTIQNVSGNEVDENNLTGIDYQGETNWK